MSLVLIILLPFFGAIPAALMIRSGRDACAMTAGSFNLLALALLLTNIPAILRGDVIRADITSGAWCPVRGRRTGPVVRHYYPGDQPSDRGLREVLLIAE
jgi:multicomponent K+:H+ antiporter subunit A